MVRRAPVLGRLCHSRGVHDHPSPDAQPWGGWGRTAVGAGPAGTEHPLQHSKQPLEVQLLDVGLPGLRSGWGLGAQREVTRYLLGN